MQERSVREDLASYYTELLEEHERSGLSVAEFAEEVGVSSATLYAWRRRLGPEVRSPQLLEVEIDSGQESGGAGAIGLVVGGRFRVELEAGFDEGTLERLLGVLARC